MTRLLDCLLVLFKNVLLSDLLKEIMKKLSSVDNYIVYHTCVFLNNFLGCVNINDLNVSLNYAEWNDLGLQNKPVLLSFRSYCGSKLCQKQRPITDFYILTVPRVPSSFHQMIFVYSICWETFVMFGKLQLNLYFTGQNKSE